MKIKSEPFTSCMKDHRRLYSFEMASVLVHFTKWKGGADCLEFVYMWSHVWHLRVVCRGVSQIHVAGCSPTHAFGQRFIQPVHRCFDPHSLPLHRRRDRMTRRNHPSGRLPPLLSCHVSPSSISVTTRSDI